MSFSQARNCKYTINYQKEPFGSGIEPDIGQELGEKN